MIYALGAVIFAIKWPEKYFKHKYDIVGSSHQIFHVCVVVASVIHLWASIKMFRERQLYQCPPID